MTRPGTVMVVDDDLSVRRSLMRLLESSGYDTLAFGSAEELLALTEWPRPCCFVVDISMPGTTGFELLDALRQRTPDVQVILISGVADASRLIRAHSAGAVAFLAKPFDATELLALVERALHRAATPTSAAPDAVDV